MTNDKGMSSEERCESLYGVNKTFTYISKETLRDLFGLVAKCVFDRWAKENTIEHMRANDPHVSSEDDVTFSAQTFIVFLQAFVRLKQDIELDVLAQQFAFNHEHKELLNKIATIISHTYIEAGDGAEFADDEALLMIRDLLLTFDSTIISRNRFNRVTSRYKSGYKFGKSK
jgi:coproporphyrinogen III oxidase-like Fe-S oxidoreductase